MKVVVIRSNSMKVEVESMNDKKTLDGLKRLIGCALVGVHSIQGRVDIWFDDEFMYNNNKNGFMLPFTDMPILGNAVVCMSNEDGQTVGFNTDAQAESMKNLISNAIEFVKVNQEEE